MRSTAIHRKQTRCPNFLGLALLILLTGTGCHKHVVLNAPPASAPLQERVAAYEKLQPLSMHETHLMHKRGLAVTGFIRRVDYLQLANSERVYYPEDLLPAVGSDSATGQAAKRSKLARTRARAFMGFSIGSFTVGTGAVLVPILTRNPDEPLNTTPMWIGSGLAIVGTILYFVSNGFAGVANDEASTAFETYDSSLRNNLNLCDSGQGWSACR